MKLETADDQLMALSAFDYCLGRMTYMVTVCTEWVKQYWAQIEPKGRTYIVRQIQQAKKNNRLATIDYNDWQDLLEWIDGQETE